MRAVALTEYGDADVMSVGELPDPLVGPDVVLVRVAAAGVNPVDYKIRQGHLRERFPHHVPLIPGWDVAGTVEQVGPAVTEFAPGDEVLGYVRKDHVQWGTYAELVAAPRAESQPQVVNNTTWHAPAAWETARRPRIRAGAPARPASGCGSRPRSPPPDAGRRPPPR